ncbi:MAG: ribosome hibernation-promoting factor, HPF/YfiA family [Guyparkeria sp.]|uniref:ribosome hibernation-promoting factor, HPF/YfiA family n=1 Tax=Guyparkeria sp. TaxID=2035736 RepID=UPI00397AB618
MQIDITGHHVDVTEALKSHVHEKFARLERHFDKLVDIHVILTVERKDLQKAEANLFVSGQDMHAEAITDDMYASIDAMINKLDRQIVKHKEKLTSHR